jgi:hypothetical protein
MLAVTTSTENVHLRLFHVGRKFSSNRTTQLTALVQIAELSRSLTMVRKHLSSKRLYRGVHSEKWTTANCFTRRHYFKVNLHVTGGHHAPPVYLKCYYWPVFLYHTTRSKRMVAYPCVFLKTCWTNEDVIMNIMPAACTGEILGTQLFTQGLLITIFQEKGS